VTGIVAFISSALDEEEKIARALMNATVLADAKPDFCGTGGPCAEAYWDQFKPHRMLADITAKRKILAEHRHEEADPKAPGGTESFGCVTCHWGGTDYGTGGDGWCLTVRLLASPLSCREGYDPAWAVD